MRPIWMIVLAALLAGCGATASDDTQGDVRDGGSDDTLSAQYPRDQGMAADDSVLFFDDFENGWGRWDWPQRNTEYLTLENDVSGAHSGNRYLRSTVSEADLEADSDTYISSSTGKTFDKKSDVLYVRFYAKFVGLAPSPGHWVRFAARADGWNSSGLANTVPPGDKGFWFDLDATRKDDFMFYAYWYRMRSGRCNDGTAVPGCAGDQGRTYYYGNVFHPSGQSPFPRDQWVCIEVKAKANTVGQSDGELALWVDDQLVEHYRPGGPRGSWLRAKFFSEGDCHYSACPEPAPFEGFDFRSSDPVRFGQLFLDAYNELASFRSKLQYLRDQGLTPSATQTILYDDVVAATRRIGCRVD